MDLRIPLPALMLSALLLATVPGASTTAGLGAEMQHLEVTPGESSDVVASFDLGAVSLEDVEATLEATEFQHPSTGSFVLDLVQDLTPVNVAMGWYDEQDNLIMVDTIEFVWQSANPLNQGRITASEAGLGGYLVVEGVDLEISGEWVADSLQIQLLGAPRPHVLEAESQMTPAPEVGSSGSAQAGCDPLLALTAFADCQTMASAEAGDLVELQRGSPSIESLRTDGSTGHNHPDRCDQLMANSNALTAANAAVDCGEIEETAPGVPVGDDYEDVALTAFTAAAAASSGGTPIKVFAVNENKASRAASDCSQANDKVYAEAGLSLECKHVNAGTTRHYQGTGDGDDDWQDFINDYFTGQHSYRTTADNFNGGRFVTFFPNEGLLDGPGNGGLTYGCEFDWASRSNTWPCGFSAIVSWASSYFGHSASYMEGLFFTHELVHTIGAVSSESDDGVHDNRVEHKNYNGKEGCYGWGNDFVTHNTFYETTAGGNCDHMHYWISNEIECYVQIYADYHTRHYPAPSAAL